MKRCHSSLISLAITVIVVGSNAHDCFGQARNDVQQDLTTLSLEDLGKVKITSASLHEQTLQDAPASVTVITAEEIRQSGYRTLSDALSWVAGFYPSYDYTYMSMGIRGFSLPGFETRYLILINGHNISENVSNSTFVGAEFPLDMELVDHIEVVRGPASALYGSSAMLATINVITRKPGEMPGASVRMETDSRGEHKIEAYTAIASRTKTNLVVGGAIFNDAGAHQIYFPAFDGPATNFGRAINMDGQKGYHIFADLTWGNWEAVMIAGDRVKIQPLSWGGTVFNDRGTRLEDSRGFFELSWNKDLPRDRMLSWRTSYDEYRFRGMYRYLSDDATTDSRERDYGDWLRSSLTWSLPDSAKGHLTIGTEAEVDLRALQNAFDLRPVSVQWLDINRVNQNLGVFAQQEFKLGPRWDLNAGVRFDWTHITGSATSPRISLIYKPTSTTDVKLMYGRGFRNPSLYDMFWQDGITQLGNNAIRPETTDSFELDVDHAFTRNMRASASAYRYQVNDMITQTYTTGGLIQFVNSGHVAASGFTFELDWSLPHAMRLLSSLAIQRAVFQSTHVLPNSPGQAGKTRLFAPMWRGRLTLVMGIQALGQRQTLADATLPCVILPDVVVSAHKLPGGLEISAGANNVSNTFYRDPVGLSSEVDTVIAPGRTWFINLTWHGGEKTQSALPGSRTQGSAGTAGPCPSCPDR